MPDDRPPIRDKPLRNINEAFNSDRLIEFLGTLIKDAGKKVLLFFDNVQAADRKEKIELYYVPSDSPALNPDERLNAYIAQYVLKSSPIQGKTEGNGNRTHAENGQTSPAF